MADDWEKLPDAKPAAASWEDLPDVKPAVDPAAARRSPKDAAMMAAMADESEPVPMAEEPFLPALDPTTKTGAIAQGAMQGPTFGNADELAGLAAATANAISPSKPETYEADPLDPSGTSPTEKPQPSFGDAYRQTRDQFRENLHQAQKAHPGLTLGSSILTSLANPGPKGGGTVANKAATGAGLAALYGIGGSDADLSSGKASEYAKFLADEALSAGGGAALGGTLGWASSKLSPWLEKFARERAYKALDPYMDSIRREGRGLAPEDLKEKMLGLGKRALDEGVVPKGPLERFSTSEGLAKNAAKLRDEAGVIKGALVDSAQDQLGGRPISNVAIANKLKAAADEAEQNPATIQLASALRRRAEEVLESTMNRTLAGKGMRLTLPEAEAQKTALQNLANYQTPLLAKNTPLEASRQIAARVAKEASEGAIEKGLGPHKLDAFKAAKSRFGELDSLADTAGLGSVRNFRNQWLGMGDRLAAETAPQTGDKATDSLMKLVWPIANKWVRERGSAAAARTARDIGDAAKWKSQQRFAPRLSPQLPDKMREYFDLLNESEKEGQNK